MNGLIVILPLIVLGVGIFTILTLRSKLAAVRHDLAVATSENDELRRAILPWDWAKRPKVLDSDDADCGIPTGALDS